MVHLISWLIPSLEKDTNFALRARHSDRLFTRVFRGSLRTERELRLLWIVPAAGSILIHRFGEEYNTAVIFFSARLLITWRDP